MSLLQVIIWHFRTQMMHMMKPNISGYPLQKLGQLVIRASIYRGFHIAPFIFVLKVGILKLMLYIEQPDPQQAGYEKKR